MKHEKLRQREVLKYYQSWLESSSGLHTNSTSHAARSHPDRPHIKVSRDNALIAFAQLGCLRLDAKRSIVTLIDTEHQYILAEATKTLSLVSGDGDYDANDEIWFGSATLPRGQGISGDALSPANYTATGRDGLTYNAPALVIDDMTKHEVYGSRPYAGQGVSFYCGVPIETECGVPIGVYTVTDNKPRNGITPSELRFMHDMAATVMRHLDSVSNEAARFRGETMVLGLGKFISGAPSLYAENQAQSGSPGETAASDIQSSTAGSTRLFKGLTITALNTTKFRLTATNPMSSEAGDRLASCNMPNGESRLKETFGSGTCQKPTEITNQSQPDIDVLQHSTSPATAANVQPAPVPGNIFARAATILQECMAADGVLFFDAVSSDSARRSCVAGPKPWGASYDSNTNTDEVLKRNEDGASSPVEQKDGIPSTHSAGSEESDIGFSNDAEARICRLLGYAFDTSSQSSAEVDFLENVKMTERSLNKLVKRYPQGKLFSSQSESGFSTSDGEYLQSEGASDPDRAEQGKAITSDRSKRIPRAISDELERLVPHAQSIVWLPLWDFSKQRWSAGLFLWSRRPDRLVAAQDDLVYLKAFANSIMVEVVRLDCAMADTAKSTFIANISHELRTPLHGVLGNLDILQDTKLSEFQHSLVTAIEVCGRTLSDTIDHVLDYSKINQLSKHKKRNLSRSGSSALTRSGASASEKGSMIEKDFDVAVVVEEAVEAAYASFAFQNSGRTKLRAPRAAEEPSTDASPASPNKSHNVHVIMNIEHREDWWAHSQPSAIRRIVTNLFGNALKYTEKGTIEVVLSSPRPNAVSTSSSCVPVILTIKDTGRGMSADFVRDHAFTPFSQESQFSIGTGLGLSIVQQIVKSLGGKIELRSDQGIGTEIKVSLHLPHAQVGGQDQPHAVSLSPKSNLTKLANRSLRVTAADTSNDDRIPRKLRPVAASLEKLAQAWYGLQVTCAHGPSKSDTDFVLYLTPPTSLQLQQLASALNKLPRNRSIVVAHDTIHKASLATRYAKLAPMGIHVDIISYPLGPHKLGRTLLDHMAHVIPRKTDVDTPLSDPLRVASSRIVASAATSADITLVVKSPQVQASTAAQLSKLTGLQGGATSTARFVPLLDHPQPLLASSRLLGKAGINTLKVPLKITQQSSDDCSHGDTSFDRPFNAPRSLSAPSSLISSLVGTTPDELPLRILLVDDNDINLSILRTCMKRAQIAHDFAKDGLQARNLFEHAYKSKQGFSHVLMDVSMPVMDGIQATREIREFERRRNSVGKITSRTDRSGIGTKSRPDDEGMTQDARMARSRAIIIALSGVASEATQQEMLAAGADMFLPKPVKLKELLKILKPQGHVQ